MRTRRDLLRTMAALPFLPLLPMLAGAGSAGRRPNAC